METTDRPADGSKQSIERAESGMAGRLSVVTSVYRSERSIEDFLRRMIAAASPHASSIEIVVVDDGSPDRSARIVREFADSDERVVLVRLSRNFGHHKALLTGLEVAEGDLVFLIDSDLEEEPENLAAMLQAMRADGADLVYGVQRERKGGSVERTAGKLFYDLFGLLSEVELPRNVSTMRLMTRRYLDSFLRFRDRNPVLAPLGIIAGYRQTAFPFDKKSRGETTYSLRRRVSMLVLAITSFTARPLVIMFWTSIVLSVLSFVYGSYVVIRALTGPVQDGWSSLMAAVAFLFSLNALFTGTLGLYVKLVLDEVKDRPRTVIQEIYRKAL